MQLLKPINSLSGWLTGDTGLRAISQYQSPLYIYSEQVIAQRVNDLKQYSGDIKLLFAMKANANPSLLRLLHRFGVHGIDAVSPGEIEKALKCGFPAKQVIFTENFSTVEQICFAISKGVNLNIGALETIRRSGQFLRGHSIFVRINPSKGAGQSWRVITGGPDSKFGIQESQIDELLEVADNYGIKIIGLHQHIGSNLRAKDLPVYLDTVKGLFNLAHRFPNLAAINVGGGVGVKYRPQEKDEEFISLQKLFKELHQLKAHYSQTLKKPIQLIMEPGRFLVAESGCLLARVTAIKRTATRTFIGTDTGFNHLIRPALYGSYHHIRNLTVKMESEGIEDVQGSHQVKQQWMPQQQTQSSPRLPISVCGNICECTDVLSVSPIYDLQAHPDDVLCIQTAGAYGMAMSSNFNERPRPAEVLVGKDGAFSVIRPRQTLKDLWRE